MKSPSTTSLCKQKPINKKRPEMKSNWRSTTYMTAKKLTFTYMKI